MKKNVTELNTELFKFLILCLAPKKENTLMSSLMANLEYLRGSSYINSVRSSCLDLCYYICMSANDGITRQTKALAIKGFKTIIKVYSTREDIQRYFKNAFTVVIQNRKPVETISILYALIKIAKIKKSFLSLRAVSDLDERIVEGYNITEHLHTFLNLNRAEMDASPEVNFYKHAFGFLEHICRKMPNVSISEKHLYMLWTLSFSSVSEKLETEFTNFVISNYSELLMDLSVFPYYFAEDKLVAVSLDNRKYFKTFVYLFVTSNSAKQLVSLVDKNMVFEIREKVDILLGLNELWNIITKIKDNTESNRFVIFAVQVYRSYSLLSQTPFIMSIYTNFINRFKVFTKNAIRQENEQAVTNLLTLAICFFRKNRFPRPPEVSRDDRLNLTIDVGSFISKGSANLNMSVLEFIVKYKEMTKLHDNYEIWVNDALVANVYILDLMRLSNINKNKEDKRLIKLKYNPAIASLYQLSSQALGQLSQSVEAYDIAESVFSSGSAANKQKLMELLNILPPLKKYSDFIEQELSDSAATLKTCFSTDNPVKFSYLLDIVVKNLKADSYERPNNIKDSITKRQVANIIGLLNEIPTDETTIDNQIKLIGILNTVIKNTIEIKVPKASRDALVAKVTDMFKYLLKNQESSGLGQLKAVLHFIFILKRLRYLNFVALFGVLSSMEGNTQAIQIAIEESNVLNQSEEELSDFMDLLSSIQNEREAKDINVFILKLVNNFLNKKPELIEEYLPFLTHVLTDSILKLDTSYDLQWLRLKIKCLIDFLSVFDQVKLDIYAHIAAWLDHYIFKTQSRANISSKYFAVLDDKEFLEIVFSLVLLLSLRGNPSFELIVQKLEDFIRFQHRRESKEVDWMLRQDDESMAEVRIFKGLQNLGCTCYINSIIQQLFMIPDFTNFILSLKVEDLGSNIAKVS